MGFSCINLNTLEGRYQTPESCWIIFFILIYRLQSIQMVAGRYNWGFVETGLRLFTVHLFTESPKQWSLLQYVHPVENPSRYTLITKQWFLILYWMFWCAEYAVLILVLILCCRMLNFIQSACVSFHRNAMVFITLGELHKMMMALMSSASGAVKAVNFLCATSALTLFASENLTSFKIYRTMQNLQWPNSTSSTDIALRETSQANTCKRFVDCKNGTALLVMRNLWGKKLKNASELCRGSTITV